MEKTDRMKEKGDGANLDREIVGAYEQISGASEDKTQKVSEYANEPAKDEKKYGLENLDGIQNKSDDKKIIKGFFEMKSTKKLEKNYKKFELENAGGWKISEDSPIVKSVEAVQNFGMKNKFLLIACLTVVLFVASGVPSAKMFGWLIPDVFTQEMWSPHTNSGDIYQPDYGWIDLAYKVLLILAVFGTLGYMLSGILGARIQAWSKQFLSNVAKSLLILTVLSSAFVLVSIHETKNALGIGLFQIDSAINFAETVRNTIIYEFVTMTSITAFLSMIGNLTPYFRPAGVIGISFSFAPAFRPIFDSLGMMLSSLAVAVGAWYVQLWFLMFVQTRLMIVLVPLGLFLRSFGVERVGNVLIAIAIGFFFVFPFVLNVSAIALENYLYAQFAGQRSVSDWVGNEGKIVQLSGSDEVFDNYKACADFSSKQGQGAVCFFKLSTFGALTFLKEFIQNAGWGTLLAFGLLQFVTGSLPSSLITIFLATYMLTLISTTVFYVLIVSILVPLFNIFITLTMIKEFTKLLGTEIDLSMFEKIF